MTQIVKVMSRSIISVAVCVLLLSGLTSVFLPNLVEQSNLTVKNVQVDEPVVVAIDTAANAGANTSLSSVLERIANENTTEQLDEMFWQTARVEIGNVFTYKENNNVFTQESFTGSEVSDWMLVFTSSNSLGDQYKVKVRLSLI